MGSIKVRLALIQNEPYRLFFPLGILFALGGVGHWLFYALGWMSGYSGFLHANIQTQLYLACFVGGFLMTAVPRFSATWPARGWELAGSLALLSGMATALFFGRWVISEILYALWLILLMRFMVVRFLKRRVQYPPVQFIWIPPAIFLGLAGALIVVLVLAGKLDPGWMQTGRAMQEQGFILALALGVGGFLGPRLMGIHQLPLADPQHSKAQIRKKILIHATCAVLLIVSFFLEGSEEDIKGYALRAVIVTGMFLWTGVLNKKIFSGPSFFVRLFSSSFWMIALGYGLIPFFPKLLVALLHLVFLGGFSLMIYCVSTMVVLNHAGHGDTLNKPLWIFWLIGGGAAVSLGLRFVATFFGEQYFLILGVSAGVWLAAAIGWFFFSVHFLPRVPGKGEPEINLPEELRKAGNAC